MLEAAFHTNYRFDTEEKAAELFAFLNEAGGVFTPARFARHSPPRTHYRPDNLTEPARILSNHPKHRAGYIILKGPKHKLLAEFRWNKTNMVYWYVEIDDAFFSKAERVEEYVRFVSELCRRFPIVFGGAAPTEDSRAKNWLITQYPDGESISKPVGLELEGCLPGVYWLTILGQPLVAHFGREKIESLPAYQIVDLGEGGIMLVLRPNPFEPDLPERLRQDKQFIEALGADYFFDIADVEKKCRPITGVTGPVEAEPETPEEL